MAQNLKKPRELRSQAVAYENQWVFHAGLWLTHAGEKINRTHATAWNAGSREFSIVKNIFFGWSDQRLIGSHRFPFSAVTRIMLPDNEHQHDPENFDAHQEEKSHVKRNGHFCR